MRVKELVAFIKEREAIRIKKEKGSPRPWTKDPILDKYRFCNVHREDDRVTRELSGQARAHYSNPDAWFWWVTTRLFNNSDTLLALDIAKAVLPFSPIKMRRCLKERREHGTIFNAAYIVSTNGVAMDKVDYLIDRVLAPLWADRKRLRPVAGNSLEGYHRALMQFDGLGSFIAAQVVADLKYMAPLKVAPDWWTFAASGPGSRRGMNRFMDRPPETPQKEIAWKGNIETFLPIINEKLLSSKFPHKLHAQDLQNCLCEFDKFERARLGEGTPKQIYKERA